MMHNAMMYRAGCRCGECRAAWAAEIRERRRAKRLVTPAAKRGRKQVMTPDQVRQVRELRAGGATVKAIAHRFLASQSMVRRALGLTK